MLEKIKAWFSKNDDDLAMYLPKDENITFILKVDDLDIGILVGKNGEWEFEYTNEFKHNGEYNRIIGFPDLNKKYTNTTLWPFFRIRIPGLKQPAIQEILERENIDKENEVELLQRFGYKTIANPYILEVALSDLGRDPAPSS